MESDQRSILRIRCYKKVYREFKKIAVDYDDYEEALEVLIDVYKKYVSIYPISSRSSSDKNIRFKTTD